MTRKNRPQLYYRSRPEQLEMRTMMAGHGFAAFPQPLARFEAAEVAFGQRASAQVMNIAQFVARNEFFGALGGTHAAALAVQLSDDTGLTAAVTYRTYQEDGETENELKVKVAGAEANSSLAVRVGETEVGTINTDADGAGTLVLSSSPDDDEQALPSDLNIAAGTTVSVGSLSGELATVERGHRCGGGQNAQITRFRSTLTDPENETATGSAVLKTIVSEVEDGEDGETTTTTKLAVRVTGAEANATLDVTVGDTLVGQVTTDDDGAAKVVFSTNPTGDQQPFTTVPTTVEDGTTVTIGTLTGTFETATSGFGRFGRRGWR